MSNVTIYNRIDQEELNELVSQLRNLTRQRADLDAEIEAVKDLIKEVMGSSTELLGPDYKISYKQVEQRRIDTKLLSATYPEVAQVCTRTTTFRRFEVK